MIDIHKTDMELEIERDEIDLDCGQVDIEKLGINPAHITKDGRGLRLKDCTDQQIVRELLRRIGDDPDRPGLLETPHRVVKSWRELYSGYSKTKKDVAAIFEKKFESKNSEMVVVGPISVFSNCEHHMLPITGTAFIGYIPDKYTIGISKLGRIVEVFARRLQIQEQLTTQIVDAISEHVKPLGAGCVMIAEHQCMTSRGIKNIGSKTRTSTLYGNFRDSQIVRQEFLSLINNKTMTVS